MIALYSNSVEWSYEKEWRIIRNFNEATVIKGKDGYDDGYDTDVLLFAVPPFCIKGVVIGYFKATKDSIDQVKSIVATSTDLSPISFSRAVLQYDGAIAIVPEPSATIGASIVFLETLFLMVICDLGQYLHLLLSCPRPDCCLRSQARKGSASMSSMIAVGALRRTI